MDMRVCMWGQVHLQARGVRSPGAGITGRYEQPDVGALSWTQVLKSSMCLNVSATSPALAICFISLYSKILPWYQICMLTAGEKTRNPKTYSTWTRLQGKKAISKNRSWHLRNLSYCVQMNYFVFLDPGLIPSKHANMIKKREKEMA